MSKRLAICTMFFLAAMVLVGTATATPINSSRLQNVLNGITTLPTPGDSSVDAEGVINDALGYDEYWQITASGSSVATLIIELAGYANINSFGVYDPSNPANRVTIFSGPDSAGTKKALSVFNDGSVWLNFTDTLVDFSGISFGYFLGSPEGVFYSETALNADGFDHMVAFQGTNTDTLTLPGPGGSTSTGLWTNNEYILAWEDLCGGGDRDYEDMVLMVESVRPIPEPGSLLLLGSGLVGMAFLGFRKVRK